MPINSDPRVFVPDRARTELRRKQAHQRIKGSEASSVKSRGPRRNNPTDGQNDRTSEPGESMYLRSVAEGVGFEPTIQFPVYTLSKRAPSATRPSLRSAVAMQRRPPIRRRAHYSRRVRTGKALPRHPVFAGEGRRCSTCGTGLILRPGSCALLQSGGAGHNVRPHERDADYLLRPRSARSGPD